MANAYAEPKAKAYTEADAYRFKVVGGANNCPNVTLTAHKVTRATLVQHIMEGAALSPDELACIAAGHTVNGAPPCTIQPTMQPIMHSPPRSAPCTAAPSAPAPALALEPKL